MLVAETLAGLTRPLIEEVQRAALAEAPITRFGLLNVITRIAHTAKITRFGLLNVITRIAHTANQDPEVRFAM